MFLKAVLPIGEFVAHLREHPEDLCPLLDWSEWFRDKCSMCIGHAREQKQFWPYRITDADTMAFAADACGRMTVDEQVAVALDALGLALGAGDVEKQRAKKRIVSQMCSFPEVTEWFADLQEISIGFGDCHIFNACPTIRDLFDARVK